MDFLAMRDERQRLAEEFRSTMTCLSMLRAQHLVAPMPTLGSRSRRRSNSSPPGRASLVRGSWKSTHRC